MKKQQAGFSVIEGFLILVILVIIGFTGWYVYHSTKVADKSYDSSASAAASVPVSSKLNTAQKQSGSQKAATANCNLSLSVGNRQGAAGTFHEDLVFTNKGSGDCSLSGFPTVTLLDSGGSQIGQPVSHDTSVSAVALTVKPNQSAYAGLSLPDPGVAPNCLGTASAQIQAVVPGINVTLKTADTTDYYCPNFMTRPFQANPSQ